MAPTLTDMLSGSMASQPMPAAFFTRASMMSITLWTVHAMDTHKEDAMRQVQRQAASNAQQNVR